MTAVWTDAYVRERFEAMLAEFETLDARVRDEELKHLGSHLGLGPMSKLKGVTAAQLRERFETLDPDVRFTGIAGAELCPYG